MERENLIPTIQFVKKITQLLEEARRSLPYNLNVIDELHANENAHSRILCKLLGYENVSKKYSILDSFIRYIAQFTPSFGQIIVDIPQITQEKERIDLWIKDRTYAIIIENKIRGAIDRNTQLERYIEKTKNADKRYNDDNIFVIYLTSDNHQPTENSWGKYDESIIRNNNCAIVSFQDNILPWLKEDILPNCTLREDILSSAIKQYIDYLEGMYNERASQKKLYHMDPKWLEELFPGKREFSEQLPELNELLEKIENAQSILLNYRKNEVEFFMNEFIKVSKELLSNNYGGEWKEKDAISDNKRWLYLYNTTWITSSNVHIEWSGVSLKDLYVNAEHSEYVIRLHVEGRWTNNEIYTNILCKHLGALSCTEKKTTFWKKAYETSKPLGQMNYEELEQCLKEIYLSPELKCIIEAVEETNKEYTEIQSSK